MRCKEKISLAIEEMGELAPELIGGYAEIKEGGAVYGGPIKQLEANYNCFTMLLEWAAEKNAGKWEKMPGDGKICGTRSAAHFYLCDDWTIEFNFSQCGISGTIYPKFLGKYLDPSEVAGM